MIKKSSTKRYWINREGFLKTVRNLLAVWLLTGLWHRGNWADMGVSAASVPIFWPTQRFFILCRGIWRRNIQQTDPMCWEGIMQTGYSGFGSRNSGLSLTNLLSTVKI